MSSARNLGVALLVGVLATAPAAACADDGDDDGAATTTTVESTTTDTPTTTSPPTEEEAILAAVDGYWQTIRDAWDPPDPTLPGFDRYFVNPAREASVSYVSERQALNQGIRLPEDSAYSHSFTLVTITADRAVVRDCSVDDSILFDRASDAVLNDATATDLWETTLVLIDDTWKVSDNSILETWDGVAACDG